jgi:serine/threonine protein kinase
LHDLGITHCDIKPENILTNDSDSNCDPTLYLVDYGAAKTYREKDGTHKPLLKVKHFVGNLLFASHHSLSFKSMIDLILY